MHWHRRVAALFVMLALAEISAIEPPYPRRLCPATSLS
jgi:hypothetical protein